MLGDDAVPTAVRDDLATRRVGVSAFVLHMGLDVPPPTSASPPATPSSAPNWTLAGGSGGSGGSGVDPGPWHARRRVGLLPKSRVGGSGLSGRETAEHSRRGWVHCRRRGARSSPRGRGPPAAGAARLMTCHESRQWVSVSPETPGGS
jgi:hypothetical protein